MMSPAKVTLSQKELELVNNADLILTKNEVIHKVNRLFGELSNQYRIIWDKYHLESFEKADFISPKIAKGEQYEGLPWVMLDYPRCFTKENTFAIRSFFWWGNACSITLQLSGIYQKKYALALQNQVLSLNEHSKKNDWLIGMDVDPWQHHFREDNCQRLDQWSGVSFLDLPFLKITKKIPLDQWDGIADFFQNSYLEILEMLSTVDD